LNLPRISLRPTALAPRFAALLAAAALTTQATAPARAEPGLWREAKAYTASIFQDAEDAVQLLADAKDNLDSVKDALEAAEAALSAAPASAIPAATAAVAAASTAVAEATAAVAFATEAVTVTALAVTTFLGATGVGQGGDWLIDWCLDPVCDFVTTNPNYVYPTNAEVDGWIPSIILNGGNVAYTRADFDHADTINSGMGTASWNYARESARMFAIAARGAAAFNAGRCQDLLMARQDLDATLFNYASATTDFANRLPALRTFTNDPILKINQARAALQQVQQRINQYQNPQQMQQIVQQSMLALSMAESAVRAVSDAAGHGLPVDGPTGRIAPLSLSQFQSFLANCAAHGSAALPAREVRVTDGLMNTLNIHLRGTQSIGPAIAAWDGLGDTGQEAALFQPSGQLIASRVLLTAVPNHWQRINLSQSPLVIRCMTGCVADLDDGAGGGTPDGGVGIEDLLFYLYLFNAGLPRADVDNGSGAGTQDGGVGIEDLLYYLQRYNAGC